jgi:hypothetical protein
MKLASYELQTRSTDILKLQLNSTQEGKNLKPWNLSTKTSRSKTVWHKQILKKNLNYCNSYNFQTNILA